VGEKKNNTQGRKFRGGGRGHTDGRAEKETAGYGGSGWEDPLTEEKEKKVQKGGLPF